MSEESTGQGGSTLCEQIARRIGSAFHFPKHAFSFDLPSGWEDVPVETLAEGCAKAKMHRILQVAQEHGQGRAAISFKFPFSAGWRWVSLDRLSQDGLMELLGSRSSTSWDVIQLVPPQGVDDRARRLFVRNIARILDKHEVDAVVAWSSGGEVRFSSPSRAAGDIQIDVAELARVAAKVTSGAAKWADPETDALTRSSMHAPIVRDILALGNGFDPDDCEFLTWEGDHFLGEFSAYDPDGTYWKHYDPLPGDDYESTKALLADAAPDWRLKSMEWEDNEPHQVIVSLTRKDGLDFVRVWGRREAETLLLATASAVSRDLRAKARAEEQAADEACGEAASLRP